MPYIPKSEYGRPPWYFFNGHWETIIPSALYKVEGVDYQRERLELIDGDFLDLDWVRRDPHRLIIISHGLEGNSDRHYVKRAAKFFSEKGWSAMAWNCRSCSGEMNRLPRFYHHGDTPDLVAVIEHAIKLGFEQIGLFGLSMGGSMTLKYLGERPRRHEQVFGAVTFSVPCNLKDSADQLLVRGNRFYEKRFLNKLKKKIVAKSQINPSLDVEGLEQIKDFETFHRRFTVPLHGFENLEDFYEKATCDQFLTQISKPALIVNAWNDPLLGEKCYPKHLVADSDHVFMETPDRGGHVGFTITGDSYSWMEHRAWSFFSTIT